MILYRETVFSIKIDLLYQIVYGDIEISHQITHIGKMQLLESERLQAVWLF